MAGTQKTSQFTAATVANPTDEVPLLQGGVLKRVQVKTLVGNPDVGWLSTGESWTYSSWDATRRIGVVNVPSDATTKYTAGNRVRISQTTGGTKYAIITYVTSTTLTLHFPSGITLNNEAISTPFYSPLDSPLGFNKDPNAWYMYTYVTSQTAQSYTTAGVWYNIASVKVDVGPGVWNADQKMVIQHTVGTSQPFIQDGTAISTSSSSPSNVDATWSNQNFSASAFENDGTHACKGTFTLTANGSLYQIVKSIIGVAGQLYTNGDSTGSRSWLRAITAYL